MMALLILVLDNDLFKQVVHRINGLGARLTLLVASDVDFRLLLVATILILL